MGIELALEAHQPESQLRVDAFPNSRVEYSRGDPRRDVEPGRVAHHLLSPVVLALDQGQLALGSLELLPEVAGGGVRKEA